MRIFYSLISRWMISWRWRYRTALQISKIILAAFFYGKILFFFHECHKLPSVMYSRIIYRLTSSLKIPYNFTTFLCSKPIWISIYRSIFSSQCSFWICSFLIIFKQQIRPVLLCRTKKTSPIAPCPSLWICWKSFKVILGFFFFPPLLLKKTGAFCWLFTLFRVLCF